VRGCGCGCSCAAGSTRALCDRACFHFQPTTAATASTAIPAALHTVISTTSTAPEVLPPLPLLLLLLMLLPAGVGVSVDVKSLEVAAPEG
jgi:hypothetical protein